MRGCLLKAEPVGELIPALETIALHHQFRSRRLIEICEKYEGERGKIETLTRREREILRFIAQDLSNKEIATKLGVSKNTIDTHRTRLKKKLGLRSPVALTRYAVQHGLVEL